MLEFYPLEFYPDARSVAEYEALLRRQAEEQMRLEQYRAMAQVPPPEAHRTTQQLRDELENFLRGAGAGPAEATYNAEATRRARVLLLRHLTKEQRGQYKTAHSFNVKGGTSGDVYGIAISGVVIRLRDRHEFCLQIIGEPVPPEDAMLARKILIETNEPLFLSTANDLTATRERNELYRANPREYVPDHIDAVQREIERERRIAERQAFHEAQAQRMAEAPTESAFHRWWREWATRHP